MADSARWHETASAECKGSFDGSTRDKAHLAKEVAAFANSGGGTIVYGVDREGVAHGLPDEVVSSLDPARVGDYVSKYIGEQRVMLTVEPSESNGVTLVLIRVASHDRPPIVMERPGTFGDGTAQETLFDVGAVFSRVDTKACPARRADFERWAGIAERRGEQQAYALMRQVAERPPGTTVQFALPDTPANRLLEAAQRFGADRTSLLAGDELVRLAASTDELDLSKTVARELLVQSSLRKRATLWWWIAELAPSSEWLGGALLAVLEATDRDVSDAGKPLLELAAVGCPDAFPRLRAELAASKKYTHFREAADAYEDVDSATASLAARVRRFRGSSDRAHCLDALKQALSSQPSATGSATRSLGLCGLRLVLEQRGIFGTSSGE